MAHISLVSRVRTRRKNGKKHGKNSKKTTRRATSAIWRIFAELDKPKRALSKMNLTSMDRWRQACFSHVFKVQTLTTKDCKGPQTNMPKNVGSIKT